MLWKSVKLQAWNFYKQNRARSILLSLLTSDNKLGISNAKVGRTIDPNKNCEKVKTDLSVLTQNEKDIWWKLLTPTHKSLCIFYTLKKKNK